MPQLSSSCCAVAPLWLIATSWLVACSGDASEGVTPGAVGGSVAFSGTVPSPGGATANAVGNGGSAANLGGKSGTAVIQAGSAFSGGASALVSTVATTGGSVAKGGATSNGGTTAKGGATTGGSVAKGGATSSGGTTAKGGATSSGGTTSSGRVFAQCRFHFGTIDSVAKNAGASMIDQLDFFTPGWMMNAAFDQKYVCDEGNTGGALANQVPAVVTYIAANYVKNSITPKLCDCNVTTCGSTNGKTNDLCNYGAERIAANWTAILNAYKSYSAGYAACYGTTRPIVFKMEPDWYQYTISSQSVPWTPAQAGSRMTEIVNALKTSLPNARFAMDVAPWVGPSNGGDNGASWFGNFNMGLFTFIATSGGGTNANTAKIRSSNEMTWAGVVGVTGKPMLADTGYGANGVSAGHDPNWDAVNNINARIADGVIALAQYNPNSNWGTTISGIRSQLNAPKYCP